MRDFEIRPILLEFLDEKYGNDSNTRIIEEFGLCQGNARVDVAVINGSIHGYEIKSEKDTLKRLPTQKEYYNRTLDFVTLVCEEPHIKKAKQIIPTWWGIYKLENNAKKKEIFEIVRQPQKNPSLEIESVIQLLWREEAMELLRLYNKHRGLSNKPRKILWDRLVSQFEVADLKAKVLERIKSRNNWRVG